MGNIKVGVVTARWNSEITQKLEEGAISYLESCEGVEIFAALVPGAVEVPLACQAFLDAGCDGVVALGAVIRGETSHYDYVCNSVTDGITRLMLDYKKPIGFGILTTENEEQAIARTGSTEHMNKGEEAAQVVMEMIGLIGEIPATMRTALQMANNPAAKAKAPKAAKTSKPAKAAKKAPAKAKKSAKKGKK